MQWLTLVIGFAAGLVLGMRVVRVRGKASAAPIPPTSSRGALKLSGVERPLTADDDAFVDRLVGELGIEEDDDDDDDLGSPASNGGGVPEIGGQAAADEVGALTRGPAGVVRERLQRVLANLPVGIVVTDPEGRPAYRNELASEFASGRHTDTLVDAAIAEVALLSRETGRCKRELTLYGPPRRFLVLRGSELVDKNRYVGTVVSIEDTTENHRVADIRRDFVANVSHELKTPVGAMSVLAETLVDADDPEIIDRLSNRVLREAIRLGDTIDDLLTLSQVESGEVFEPRPTPIGELIDAAMGRVASAAEQREIELEVRARDLEVFVDRRQFVSALANLVDNAIKYSDAGSTVEIEVERQGEWTSIAVTDHGIGIPEGDLERVFERFYRVDPSRRRDTGGTGLGLSIVRNVAVAHGGEVGVRSAEGQGSTFTLRLPITSPTGDDAPPARARQGANP